MFHNVAEGVSRYLQPSEPVVIYHTVRVDPEDYQPMQVFDIPIEMDDVAVKAKMQKVVAGFSQDVDGNITALDDEVTYCLYFPLWRITHAHSTCR